MHYSRFTWAVCLNKQTTSLSFLFYMCMITEFGFRLIMWFNTESSNNWLLSTDSWSDFDQSSNNKYRYYLTIQFQLIHAQATLNDWCASAVDWLYILTALVFSFAVVSSVVTERNVACRNVEPLRNVTKWSVALRSLGPLQRCCCCRNSSSVNN